VVAALATVAAVAAAGEADKVAAAAAAAGPALRGSAVAAPRPARPLSLDFPVLSNADIGEYVHFYVPTSPSPFPLRVSVSPTMGDPDLFVGCGAASDAAAYPTNDENKWSSRAAHGTDSVDISAAGFVAAHCRVGDAVLISVHGFTNSTYMILAHKTSPGTSMQLYDGQPIGNTLAVREYDQYSFRGQGDVTITVESTAGDADLYVTCAPAVPAKDAYRWSSAAAGSSDDVVHVAASDANYCSGGFNIAVYAYSGSAADSGHATYVVTATGSAAAPQRLLLNLPQVGYVDTGEYAYFAIDAATVASKGLKVTLATQNPEDPSDASDADLYIGCSNDADGVPTRAHNRRASVASGHRPEAIIVAVGDDDFCDTGTSFVVGVLGFRAASFAVLATPNDNDMSLIDLPYGVTVAGRLSYGGLPEYYTLPLPAGAQNATIWVESFVESGLHVVAIPAFPRPGQPPVLPSPETGHWTWGALFNIDAAATLTFGGPKLDGASSVTIGLFPIAQHATPAYLIRGGHGPTAAALEAA